MQKCVLYRRESVYYILTLDGEETVYLIRDGQLVRAYLPGTAWRKTWRSFSRFDVEEVEQAVAKRILRRINKLCHVNFELDEGERAIFRKRECSDGTCEYVALLPDRAAKFDYLPKLHAAPDCWLVTERGVFFAANYQKVMRESRAASEADYAEMKWKLEHLTEYPIRLNPVVRLIPRQLT